jgi:hypothetical protein
MTPPRPRWLPAAALVACVVVAAACDEGNAVRPVPTQSGTPRTFAMGVSSLPTELTEESYADAFDLAGRAGEVVLIQRTPPWQELLSGSVSQETASTTRREVELADEHDLDLFLAIDPTDAATGREELAGLPADLRGAGFADGRVREAFLAYARYVAENYRPAYLALGVEVNTYARVQPEDFASFVSLYKEAYAAAKQLSPGTLVFPIFQFEELQGLLPLDETAEPQWDLIDRFEPEMDILAVSSYPSAAFATAEEIPLTYYSQLALFTTRPVAIAQMGFAPATDDIEVAEAEQGEFLTRALDGAQRLSMPLVVWFVGQDLTYTGQPPLDQVARLGLKRVDGSPKTAWLIWEAAVARPLAAPPASR